MSSKEENKGTTSSKLARLPSLLEELEKTLQSEEQKLEVERTKVNISRKEWEDSRAMGVKKMQFPARIKLDVGGKVFTTSLSTLTGVGGTFFSGMFSGTFKVETDKEDGSIFIDRDPLAFTYILNFLRGQQPDLNNITEKELFALKEDAKYYQLDDLVDLLHVADKVSWTWDSVRKSSLMTLDSPATFRSTSSNGSVIMTTEPLGSVGNKIKLKIEDESNWTYVGVCRKTTPTENVLPETHTEGWFFKSHKSHDFIRLFNNNQSLTEINGGPHFGYPDTIILSANLSTSVLRVEVDGKPHIFLEYKLPQLLSTNNSEWYFAVALNSNPHRMTILPI